MHHDPIFIKVLLIIIILLLGAVFKKISARLMLPYTISLMLAGLAAGLAVKHFGGDHGLFGLFHMPEDTQVISPDIIIFVFLPALIFESAFALDGHVFRKNLAAAITFAGPALLVTTCLTAGMMVIISGFGWEWGWIAALVFGTLISATDPVAVVAILKELGVSKRLATLIEGESLLNDGTAIVIFSVLFAMVKSGSTEIHVVNIIMKFVWVVTGGLAIGYILSVIFSNWIGRMFNDPLAEITLTIVLGYLCMLIAEGMLHVSGVMALVVAGLYMGSVGRTRISPEVFHFLHHFWELTAYIANTLIFFLVGLVVAQSIEHALLRDLLIVFAIYIGIMGIRFAVSFLFRPVANCFVDKITFPDITLISWGGLRGAVSLALALIVSQEHSIDAGLRNQVLLITAGVVFLSILVNGTSMKKLLSIFGYDKTPLPKKMAGLTAKSYILGKVKDKIKGISQSPQLGSVSWKEVNADIEKRSEELQSVLEETREKLETAGPEMRAAGYWIQVLSVERKAYWKAFAQGTLGPRGVLMLNAMIDQHADRITRGEISFPEERLSSHSAIYKLAAGIARKSDFINKQFSTMQFDYLALQYDLARAESYASDIVLDSLEHLKDIEADIKEGIDTVYRQFSQSGREMLEEMRENLPEVTRAIEARLTSRIALNIEREIFDHMVHDGAIDEEIAQNAIDEIEERMTELIHGKKQMPLPEISDLIREVPIFESLTDQQYERLAELAKEVIIPRDENIFKENDRGDSLYIVVRGAIQILKLVDGKNTPIGLLGGGDILGEIALLTGEARTASAKAVTSAAVIMVPKQALDELVKMHSGLMDEIWESYISHGFENAVRNQPMFDYMGVEEREEWFKTGKVVVIGGGTSADVPEDFSLAFIATGSADFGDGERKSGQIVNVTGKSSVKVIGETRIVWLPAAG